MKIISSNFLFFVGLILLSTISSGQKKNDALKNGKLTLAFGYKSGDKVQTIFPLNGGNINKDSLSLADQLIFVYKTKEKSYTVKEARYSTCFLAPGKDILELDNNDDFFKDQFSKLITNEKIIIYVDYIILDSNDTIFTPAPVKSGVYRRTFPGYYMMQQSADSSFYKKVGDYIVFTAPAFEFIVK